MRRKPDLRRERWTYGPKGEKYACLTIDIPEEQVLLHNFDSWSLILLDALISETEAEDQKLERAYMALDAAGKKRMKETNWKRVFDISPLENHWILRGSSIQATFWELRKEQIKNVRFFVAALNTPKYSEENH